MKKTVERIRSLQMPMAFWLLLIVAVMPLGYFLYLAMTASNSQSLIVLGIIFAVLLFCLGMICCYRICIDEHGVTAYEGLRRRHLPWSEVRSVHVVRLVNGWRVIYVSKSNRPPILPPYAPHPQTQALVKAYLQETITLGFTRKRLACIRQYWQGDILNPLTGQKL